MRVMFMKMKFGQGIAILFITALVCSVFAPGAGVFAEPLDALIIRDGDIEGFVTVKKPAWFRPESLWNYIDGGALPYLDYGVGDVVTYSGTLPPERREIVVDIYDMQNNTGAFGIYASERFPDNDFIDIGNEGYTADNSVCFWKDRYYVKVFSNDAETPSADSMLLIARTVDKRIPEGEGMPSLFSLFPAKDRMPKSEAYVAKNVLGQDYLAGDFMVKYPTADGEYQLHIIRAADSGESTGWFVKYREFMQENGKAHDRKADIGEESFAYVDDWYGLMLFARKGRYILGSVGNNDFEASSAILTAMSKELPK